MQIIDPLIAFVLRNTLRLLLKPVLSPRLPLKLQRTWLEILSGIGRLPKGIVREHIVLAGVEAECWKDEPASSASDGTILLLHGGGYCAGSPRTHRALAAWLARASGLPLVVPNYRLGPEHPFPAAINDALAVYEVLASRGPVLVMGDSAGGGLALALAMQVRDSGLLAPTALALLSPLVDLRATHRPPSVRGEAMLSAGWMEACASHYAYGATDNPLVSPLLGDHHGLPPVLIQCGTDELLCDQSRALHTTMQAAGVDTVLEVAPRRWHVYQLHASQLPSADAALARIARFFKSATRASQEQTVR